MVLKTLKFILKKKSWEGIKNEFSKIFTLIFIALVLISIISSLFADFPDFTRNEIEKLITIEESRTLTTFELHKLIEVVD